MIKSLTKRWFLSLILFLLIIMAQSLCSKIPEYLQEQSIDLDQNRTIYMKLNQTSLAFQVVDFEKKAISQKIFMNSTIKQILSVPTVSIGFDVFKQAFKQKKNVKLIDQTTIQINLTLFKINVGPTIETFFKNNINGQLYEQLFSIISKKYQKIHKQSKSLSEFHRLNTYQDMPFYFNHNLTTSLDFKYVYEQNKIQKMNGDNWKQLVNVKELPKEGKFRYSFQILFLKGNNFLLGAITQNRLNISGISLASNDAIDFHFADGKNYKRGANLDLKGKPLPRNKNINVSMEINMNQNQITWFIQNQRQSSLDFPRQFSGLKLYPYLSMFNQGDQIKVLIPNKTQQALIQINSQIKKNQEF